MLQASVVQRKEKISMNYKDQNQDHKIFHRDRILSRDVRSLIRFASAFGLCQQECVTGFAEYQKCIFHLGSFNTSEKSLPFMDINTFNFQI